MERARSDRVRSAFRFLDVRQLGRGSNLREKVTLHERVVRALRGRLLRRLKGGSVNQAILSVNKRYV